MKIKKIILVFMLILSLQTQPIYSLNLIDNIDKIYKEIEKSPVATLQNSIEISFNKEISHELKSYKGYVLNSDFKYLINENILHEFDKKDNYLKTVLFEESSDNIVIQFKNVKTMHQEKHEYKKAGFNEIPSIHYSLIPKNIKYYNQLNNKIYPNTSCVPTAISMYLSLLNIESVLPDTISKDLKKLYEGSYLYDVFDWLEFNEMYLTNVTYYRLSDLETIFKALHKGKPFYATIKSSFIKYPDKNSVVNNRLYNVRTYENGEYYHAVLITGYLIVNDVIYLEFYDSWSKGYSSNLSSLIPDGKGKYMTLDEFKKVYYTDLTTFEFIELEKNN